MEDEPILTSIFFKGVGEKPPTRFPFFLGFRLGCSLAAWHGISMGRPDFNPNALFKEQLKSVKVEELWEELAGGVAGVVRWVG